MLTGIGKFTGVNGHEMRGAFRFVQTDAGYVLETDDDFFFDAKAPAPVWALGDIAGKHIPGSDFQPLNPFTELNGCQVVAIKAGSNALSAESVIAWCTKLRIELGVGVIRHWTTQ